MNKRKNQMSFRIEDELETLPPSLPPGKDEMNFAELPIALVTDRVPKGQTLIKFEDEIYDEKRRRMVTRRRLIEGSEEYGLPTATDDLVILALIQLTKLKGDFRTREVEFTRLELIKLLGWANEGKSYDRIKLSLLRIQSVNYVYDNAWYDNRQKTYTTKAFHIIDNVEINDSRATGGQVGLFPSRIVWNEVVFDSFQASFLRDIDFQLCLKLEHPTAVRMYRFMGKRFYVRPEWIFDLKKFAYDHIGIGRNYEGGTQIARKLKPAIEELEKVGFLETLDESERFIKKGRDWSIRLIQKAPAPPLPAIHAAETASPSSPLVDALASRSVTKATAAGLVAKFPADYIEAKLDVFDWMTERTDKRIAKSPAGYLVSSIEKDYAPPPDFVPKAERERQRAALAAKEQQATEDRRRQRQADATEKKKRQEVEAYWLSLTPEQQAELDAASMDATPADDLAQEKGPLKATFQKIRRDRYIRHLLDQAKAKA